MTHFNSLAANASNRLANGLPLVGGAAGRPLPADVKIVAMRDGAWLAALKPPVLRSVVDPWPPVARIGYGDSAAHPDREVETGPSDARPDLWPAGRASDPVFRPGPLEEIRYETYLHRCYGDWRADAGLNVGKGDGPDETDPYVGECR